MNRTHKSSSPVSSDGQLTIQTRAKAVGALLELGLCIRLFPRISSYNDLQLASCIFVSAILVFLLHSYLSQKKRDARGSKMRELSNVTLRGCTRIPNSGYEYRELAA